MRGLVVVGLIFEEIPNITVKCVSHWSAKYRSRSPGQGTCRVSTSRRTLYKVWWLKALQLRTYGRAT